MTTTNPKRVKWFKLLIVVGTLAIAVIVFITLAIIRDKPFARHQNEELYKRNEAVAKHNFCGFTDHDHTREKPKGVFRIAVLGDSFVWGDGLKYEDTWNHKLESKLMHDYDSIEVLHWAHNGWSTRNEFVFFAEDGKDYNIDLLLIGWVDNDPDLWNIRQIEPIQEKNWLSNISPALGRLFTVTKEHHEYEDWMEKIYTPQNLKEYQTFLKGFKNYVDSLGIKSLIVMTPGPFDDAQERHFKQMQPIIASAGFTCLNLFDSSRDSLSKYAPGAELSANPVNGHPGVLMAEEFAKEVKEYLEQNKLLQKVPQKTNQ